MPVPEVKWAEMQSQRSKGGGRLSIVQSTIHITYSIISLTDGLDKDTLIDPPIYIRSTNYTYYNCWRDIYPGVSSFNVTRSISQFNSYRIVSSINYLLHPYLYQYSPARSLSTRSKCTSTFNSTPLYTLYSTLHTSFPYTPSQGIGRESTPFLSLPILYSHHNIVSSLVLILI